MNNLLITTRLDPSRIVQSTELLKRIGLDFEVIWGYEKTNLPPNLRRLVVAPEAEGRIDKDGKQQGLTEGEIAVALTHLKALKHIIDTKEDGVIFEDDFRLWHEGDIQPEQVNKH